LGRFLATLATILVLLLGVALVVPAFVDWNAYRPDIEETASAILGRKINISGPIAISVLPEPHIRVGKVAADNDNQDGAHLRAEAAELTLSLQALLGGKLEASRLRLIQPVISFDFSKPVFRQSMPARAGAFPLTAVNQIEIEGGRISIFSKDYGGPDALVLERINGTISSGGASSPYRFNASLYQGPRQFDVKLQAAPTAEQGVKLAGSAVETASKTAFQADGTLRLKGGPEFEGSLGIAAPPRAPLLGALPVEVQIKSQARFNLKEVSLSDLALTLDPQGRPQLLSGSAAIALPARTARLTLAANFLDGDALLTGAGGETALPDARNGPDAFGSAAANVLWVHPEFALRLSLAVDQLQFKGELSEAVKLEGSRAGGRWVLERAAANLPGAAAKFAGTLSNGGATPQLLATVLLDGKNLGRFSRWLMPEAKAVPARAFSAQGSLTLSQDVFAFEGATGNVGGTAFKASLHIDRRPASRLQLSVDLADLDLSSLNNVGSVQSASAGAELKSAWGDGMARLRSFFAKPNGFDFADVTISAGSLKTSLAETSNFALHATVDNGLLTVAGLNAETAAGLILRAEGTLPLDGGGTGQMRSRIEARKPEAILQLLSLAGYDGEVLSGRHAEDFAPAALSLTYTSAQQPASTLKLSGNIGAARIEGQLGLSGAGFPDWRNGVLSAEINASALDGGKLLAQLFPGFAPLPGGLTAPGTIDVRIKGPLEKLDISAALKTSLMQAQADGTANAKSSDLVFTGRASASMETPEQYFSPPLLALLGGEPKTNLRVEASVALNRFRLEATRLRAQTAQNLTAGRLIIDANGEVTRIDAELNAGQLLLPAIFSHFLAPAPADQSAAILPATQTGQVAAGNIWSDRPFAMSRFRDFAGKLSLAAKTLKLSDALVLTDAQLAAKLENSRLEIPKLEGKALGGEFSSSAALEPKGSALAAEVRISFSDTDLYALTGPGTAPIASGRGSLLLFVSGQGLSPQGIVSVLEGKGAISLAEGTLEKISPAAVQRSAEEMLASPQPLNEAAIAKRVLEASQSADFKFAPLKMPVVIKDGVLEIRRASFRGKDSTVRMEALVDLSKMEADSTWQAGVSSDRSKWPPVKIIIAGPLRELGARPRSVAADDFARTILLRKMEGDLKRLEGLNRQTAPQSWTATQEPAQKPPARKKGNENTSQNPAQRREDTAAPAAKSPQNTAAPSFETRIRDALQPGGSQNAVSGR